MNILFNIAGHGNMTAARKVSAVIVSALLLISIPSHLSNVEAAEAHIYQPKEIIQSAVYRFNQTQMTEQTDKVVLAEMFTATWCTVCAVAEPKLEQLSEEYGDELAVLEYHPYQDTQGDIFGIQEGHLRMTNYYGSDQFPTTVFDGVNMKVGISSEEDIYTAYKSNIDFGLGRTTPVTIKIEGAVNETSGHLNVTFETQGYFSDTLSARLVVFEDDIFYDYPGSNGITNHRFVVRDIPESEDIGINKTNPADFVRNFIVEDDWNETRMGVVAFLQSDAGVKFAINHEDLSDTSNQNSEWMILVVLVAIVALALAAYALLKRRRKIDQ
jgi:thiol-disulfide isomerase/thioredoxin